MRDAPRAILHIGLHKTGTTSIQALLDKKREGLRERGFVFHHGLFVPRNHYEMHLLAMRPERDSPFRVRKNLVLDDALRARMRSHVERSVAACDDAHTLLFSGEGMSLLRHDDELERLASLVPGRRIEIVVCVRDAADWMRSYDAEMNKTPVTAATPEDKDSCWYRGPGSWLADIEGRVENFRRHFGAERVRVFEYERALAQYGNVVPAFLETIGLRPRFAERAWSGVFLNRTGAR